MSGGRSVDPAQVLQVTVSVGDHPLGTRVAGAGEDLLPDLPMEVSAEQRSQYWIVEGPDGPVQVRPGDSVEIRRGDVTATFGVVRRSWLARFGITRGDLAFPLMLLTLTVLILQFALYWRFFQASAQGGGGAEPSPEYLARLLEEQFEGKERGVAAQRTERPRSGDKIESFYLQPGQDGPKTRMGGGRDVGEKRQDGEVRDPAEKKTEVAAEPVEEIVEIEQDEPLPGASPVPVEEEVEDEELRPIALETEEGWGLSDWYDTVDARQDEEEIRRQLKLAKDLLRLDPDDAYGLSIRAYYEYLASDYAAAERTYAKFTRLYPDEPAGWNNLALVYKRRGDYVKEEELYRLALSLSPDDDHALNNLAVCLAHQGRFEEALAIMKKLETLTPDDAYADLHRAKIYAAMGKEERAYHFLQKSLAGMRKLDTLHNIEFRQDIRVDPALAEMRKQKRFHDMLVRFYGDQPGGWWKRLGTR